MDLSNVIKLLILATSTLAANGATVNVSSPIVADGSDLRFTCTSTTTLSGFLWIDPALGRSIFNGGSDVSNEPKHDNFRVEVSSGRSVMTILNIQLEDEGTYNCQAGAEIEDATIDVEVDSTRTLTLESIDDDTRYRATCTAIGSQPEETIAWILGGVTQTDGVVEGDPGTSTDPALSDVRSAFTFDATVDNYNMPLVCDISGHLVPGLNGQLSRNLDIHRLPDPNGIAINFEKYGDDFTVICGINSAVTAPIPAFSMYYIYRDNALIHESASVNRFTTTTPAQNTSFTCVAGNYLGNATSTCPNSCAPSTTTPSPTTELSTTGATSTNGTDPGSSSSSSSPATDATSTTEEGKSKQGLGAGAIAGIAIGALIIIIIIIVLIIVFVIKPDFISKGGSRGPKSSSHAVGVTSTNGKEKPIQPTAAPRTSSTPPSASVRHTNDNPGQAEYAMVNRSGPGGDSTDARKQPQTGGGGMLYADLDLSAKAGHTEQKVPQNPDNVVVYSSILV